MFQFMCVYVCKCYLNIMYTCLNACVYIFMYECIMCVSICVCENG